MPIIWEYADNPSSENIAPGIEISDIALDVNGDIDFDRELVYGADAVMQILETRIRFNLGEWFLDLREGVPYVRDILKANPDRVLIQGIFRKVIEDSPGIAQCLSIEVTIDKPNRRADINFSAQLQSGRVIVAPRQPFIFTEV